MTPGWHLVIHGVQLAALAGLGALIWRHWPGADEDVREAVIALDDDVAAAWERIEEIVTHLWALAGLPMPEGEPTEEHAAVVDEPADTLVSHPADMSLRKLTTLHRGQHRPDAGGRTVPEILAELAAATRQATISVSGRSGEAGGPTQAKGEA